VRERLGLKIGGGGTAFPCVLWHFNHRSGVYKEQRYMRLIPTSVIDNHGTVRVWRLSGHRRSGDRIPQRSPGAEPRWGSGSGLHQRRVNSFGVTNAVNCVDTIIQTAMFVGF